LGDAVTTKSVEDIEPTIALAECLTQHRILVIGSRSMDLMIDLHRRGYLRGVERQLSAAQRSNTTLRSSIGDGARAQRGAPRLYRFAQKWAPQSEWICKGARCSSPAWAQGFAARGAVLPFGQFLKWPTERRAACESSRGRHQNHHIANA
jgi:hypothetical protein